MSTDKLFSDLGITNVIGGDLGRLVYLLVFALGTSLGYFLTLYIFSVIREKLGASPVAKGFQGVAIGLIASAIMAIIFSNAFSGVF